MKFGWLNKNVPFWAPDLSTATSIALIGFTLATLVSTAKTLEDFIGLGTYIGALAVLWGARSGIAILNGKPNTISFGKMLMFVIPNVAVMLLLIIFR